MKFAINSSHIVALTIISFWCLFGKQLFLAVKKHIEDYTRSVESTLKRAEKSLCESEVLWNHARKRAKQFANKIQELDQEKQRAEENGKAHIHAQWDQWKKSQSYALSLKKQAIIDHAILHMKSVLLDTTAQRVEFWIKESYTMKHWDSLLEHILVKK